MLLAQYTDTRLQEKVLRASNQYSVETGDTRVNLSIDADETLAREDPATTRASTSRHTQPCSKTMYRMAPQLILKKLGSTS